MSTRWAWGTQHQLTVRMRSVDAEEALARHASYKAERGRRALYRAEDLHLAIVRLVLSLALAPDGRLDPAYCDKLPLLRRMQNVPHVLYHHLSHRECAQLPPRLQLMLSCCAQVMHSPHHTVS